MPKISVLMPVYNTKEEYLRPAIESILNQTFSDFEFLIMDDGSTNNAAEVIKSYKDERIKYFYHENRGIAESRNELFLYANGEYIANFDSDDISLPKRFEKQVKYLDEHSDVSILGTWFEMFPKQEIMQHPENVTFLALLKGCCIGNPTVMMRRSDIAKYKLFCNKEYEPADDYELWSRAVRYLKIKNLQEVLLNYRWEGQNISVSKKEIQMNATKKAQQNMLDFLIDDNRKQKKIYNLISFKYVIKLFNSISLFKIKRERKCEKWYLLGLRIK